MFFRKIERGGHRSFYRREKEKIAAFFWGMPQEEQEIFLDEILSKISSEDAKRVLERFFGQIRLIKALEKAGL